VLTPAEARQSAHRGEKNGKISFWLQPAQYEQKQFLEKWDRIGQGEPALLTTDEPSA
jgi:hypothetical protein